MAIGTRTGDALTTEELSIGTEVVLDHERFTVDLVEPLVGGDVAVHLLPMFGKAWRVEVAANDRLEPLWELA